MRWCTGIGIVHLLRPGGHVGLLHELDRARVLDLGQRLKGGAALRLRLECHAQIHLKLIQVLLTGGPPRQAREDGFQRHGLAEQHGLDRLHVAALDLPNGDDVISLGEQNTSLLIGGMQDLVYPWDRISPSFDFPIILPENNTVRIVSANQLAYLFTGNRGRIYVTNGSSVELLKKIPDYIAGSYEPYFAWADAMVWRNQLYFSFTATTNAGVALATTGGLWAIDMPTGAFRLTNKLSYGSYAGSATVLLPHVLSDTPPGTGVYVGWSVNSTYGVDVSSVDPYSNYEAMIDTEIIPVGTFVEKYTPRHFEFQMAMPMVSGESIRLSARKSLSDSYEVIGTTTDTVLSAPFDTPFDDWELFQFRVEMSSTATTPSYNRLLKMTVNGQS